MTSTLNNIYNIINKLIGTTDDISLEHRFLNIFALAGVIFCCAGAFFGCLLGFDYVTILFLVLTGSVVARGIYLSLKKGEVKSLYVIGVYFVTCFLLPGIWILDGGIRSTVPFYVIFQAVFLGCVTIKSKKHYHLYAYLTVYTIIIVAQYIWPEKFVYELSGIDLLIDHTVAFYLVALLSYFIVRRITLEYVKNHEKLKALNQENLELAAAAEQAYLHAQIKPHFLYNVLNTIADCCATDGEEAERLIINLSKYLRGTLGFENLDRLVSLEHEMALVKAYVEIEKARFEELKIDFGIEPNIYVMIPPMTIQPLVENAIKHGIRNNLKKGIIKVKINKTDEGVCISVEDNGQGMTKEVKDRLFLKEKESRSVGVCNINKRLEAIYNKGLIIESELEKGTKISFIIRNLAEINEFRQEDALKNFV